MLDSSQNSRKQNKNNAFEKAIGIRNFSANDSFLGASLKREDEDDRKSVYNSPGARKGINYIKIENGSQKSNESEENPNTSLSSEYSTVYSLFFSMMIMVTMALLIFSNSQDGAYVEVQVIPIVPGPDASHNIMNMSPWLSSYNETAIEERLRSAEQDFNVFHFTLTSSISDFWSADAYSLAMLIALFSGGWPYLKLLLLLIVWLYPLAPNRRQKLLTFLDQLGKYSFIDLYVCIFMAVSFYMKIVVRTRNNVGLEVNVVVELDTGVTTFAIATILSMFYSMLFVYMDDKKRMDDRVLEFQTEQLKEHRDLEYHDPQPEHPKIDLQKEEQYEDQNDSNSADSANSQLLKTDCFDLEIENGSMMHQWKQRNSWKIWAFTYDTPTSFVGIFLRSLFLMCMAANIYLCVAALYTAPNRYNLKGVAGWAVNDSIRAYTVIEIANKLPQSTDAIGPAWFCVVQYYMTVIIAPLLISTMVLCVWILPMNCALHNFLCRIMLPMQAWNAIDVFVVGTVAASVELDEVSQWIMNTNYPVCGANGEIEALFGTGCFSVVGHVVTGTYMLIVFAVFEWFAIVYTLKHIKKCHQTMTKRLEPIEQ